MDEVESEPAGPARPIVHNEGGSECKKLMNASRSTSRPFRRRGGSPSLLGSA
jgi:hypothetical protein